jgi:hypothetical protein
MMPIDEKIKAPLLAGAFLLALLPASAGAVGAGGHMGGGASFHTMTPAPRSPNVPGFGPQRVQYGDRTSTDIRSHARFNQSHPMTVTGSRIPVTSSRSPEVSARGPIPGTKQPLTSGGPQLDPPPPNGGDEQ